MANTITDETIIKINELYKKVGTYSGVARAIGVSPATVKKYIIPDFISYNDMIITHVDLDECKKIVENYIMPYDVYIDPNILCFTEKEKEDMKQLQKEVLL